MRIKQFIPILLLMIMGGAMGAKAESVTVAQNPTTNGVFSISASVSGYFTTWTSNATSGVEGLTITTSGNLGMCQQDVSVNGYGNLLAFKTSSGNTAENVTFKAPEGYLLKGYSITARLYSSSADAYLITKTNGDTQAYSGNASPISFSESLSEPANEMTITITDTKSTSKYYLCVTGLTIDLEEENAAEGVYTVVTLNNTNSSRGALIYNPAASEKWVWSSGKSGSFSPTSENCQWALVTTGTEGEYYLYNLGAKRFISPIPGGTFSSQAPNLTWAFTTAATPVKLVEQTDGNFYIITVGTMPGVFSNGIYASVSNGFTGPIISYYGTGDEGLPFVKTEVGKTTQKQDAQIAEALAQTIAPTDALADVASLADGWYAIQNRANTTASALAGNFITPFDEEYTYNGINYPLTVKTPFARPGKDEAEYYFHIAKSSENNFNWQMPNGRFLVMANKKVPVSSAEASAISITYNDGFIFSGSGWYAVPYNNSGNYFIGETSTAGKASYSLYPISLSDVGLTAWQMICDNAPETQTISCSRSDVSGLTDVYKNGYFFLPTGVTPESTDFILNGASEVVVDATAHTVTFTYDPNLAIVETGVSVAQGWQTAARGEEVKLLRVNAEPFNNATNATMTISLKDGSESNISALTLYEASSASPEVLGTGAGTPMLTQVSTTTVSNATATLNIGNLTAGTHYYWIGATVKSDAELGAIVDAAVTSITYTCNDNETTLDLTAIGDPADRGAMVFNVHSYPFLPWDNGSHVYRIPALVTADDGSLIAACDKRYNSTSDIGGNHVIDIVVRRSTDGGKTWGDPVVVAKGDNSSDATCGYGDPSLTKGKDGKLYCIFAAGNTGFMYGLNRICMVTSEDNGATWSAVKVIAPSSDSSDGITFTDKANLYDYFVTSGKGLYTTDGILMFLVDAQSASGGTQENYVFYSTDDGATWYIDNTLVCTGANEAKLEQMNDGSLIASIRTNGNRAFNRGTYVKNADGTVTFTWGAANDDITYSSELHTGAGNNQDILYYSKSSNGEEDILLHTMTAGNHANFKLFMSIDEGSTWKEIVQIQPNGARYAVMSKLANGDLGILFEDQSLNATGGSSDYNHYPINFLTLTKEQIEEWYEEKKDEANTVKVVYGTTGETTYGTLSGDTWTSNNTNNPIAGLTLTKSDGTFDKYSSWNSHYNLAYKPAAANTASTLTLTAPAGYLIKSYSLLAAKASSASHTYTLTLADGNSITPAFASSASGYTTLSQTDLYVPSTTITVETTDATKFLAIADFVIILTKDYPVSLNVVGEKSYATLYLPFDVQTDAGTKAYYAAEAANGVITLKELEDGNTPARTAVVLINDAAETKATFTVTSGLASVVDENANLLKGTLEAMQLDLSQGSSYYAMGRKDDKIGFYKFDNNGTTTITLGAYKAYLDTSAASNSSKGFTFSFGDVNGIEEVSGSASGTQGRRQDAVYNLSGQRVSQLSKGLYIVNGKKVVVK